MHKETVKNEANALLLILASVAGVFILSAVLGIVVKHRMLHDIALVVTVGVWVLYLMNHALCTYEYSLTDHELRFHRQLAGREKQVLKVSIDQLECICPAGAPELRQYRTHRTYNLCVTALRTNRYVGIFRQSGTCCKFVFEPTNQLVSLIREEQNR